MVKRLKACIESLIIIAIGLFLLINSLQISNNPIKYNGWTGVLAQAKFMPITMSSGLIILGLILFIKQYFGKDKSVHIPKDEWIKVLILLALIGGYIFCVYKFKFMIPTIVFSFAIIGFLNWNRKKKLTILLVALLAIALGLYGLPALISLKLPMM